MRRLLRRQRKRGLIALIAAVAALSVVAAPSAGTDPASRIEITSPLGRSGLPGKVRIVARVTVAPGMPPPHVRFFVDGTLVGTDADGPPYAVEWEDVNPYERALLTAEFDEPTGVIRGRIELAPYEYIEESSILSVALEASVQNPRGKFVRGLDASQFRLFEDDAEQAIDSLSSAATPATFALLVDSSRSMSRSIEFAQQAAARLTHVLRPLDAVVVAPFKNGITTVTGPTRDLDTVRDAITAITPGGRTAIFDALRDVTVRFGDGPGRRVVVLVTDGFDEQSETDPDSLLEELRSSRVTVYVISIGGVSGVSISGERLLRRLATETGGRAFFPWNAAQLGDVHATIADEVAHEYRITYTPTNQQQDGRWRVIRLETALPDHHVVARRGYRAPTPPPVRASIEFTATNELQQLVDLTRDQLHILEDGVPQEVDVFTEAVAPVSIVLALDGSGSMRRSAAAARDAAHAFVEALRPDDPLGILVFADGVSVLHDFTTDRDLSRSAVEGFETAGGTALNDALDAAALRLKERAGRRAIVLVTDGRDENAASNGPGSHTSWPAALEAASQAEAAVYAIGLGVRVDRDRLRQLAVVTGGEAYFTDNVHELEQQYRRILEELHRRYVVTYTSTNPARDGAWRHVEIRASAAGVRVRTRGGYFAPAQ